MALCTSNIPSRIGKGRLDASSRSPSAHHAFTAESTTPPHGHNTGKPPTPSSFVTPEAQILQLPPQTGHNAATPVININAIKEAPAAVAAPESVKQAATSGKWKSNTTATAGPVFSVISRGSRLPATSSASLHPPPPPAKAFGTVARTINRVQTSRGTPSSAGTAASSTINLRGSQRSHATLSTSSCGSSAPTAGHAFGSRISTGRLNSGCSSNISSTLSVRSFTTTPVVASSCKSVARVLSFEENVGSPAASPARSVHSTTSSKGPKPTAPSASKIPALSPLQSSSSATDDVVQQLDQITSSSSSGSTTWLSGSQEGSSSPLSELEASSAPPAADIFSMHINCMATAPAAPLPPVKDTASAQAAAKILLQQLVGSVSGLTAAVGLTDDAALAGLLGGYCDTGSGALLDSSADSVQDEISNSADVNSADHNRSSWLGQLLFQQTAVMLETGATAQQVKGAVLPALLLQLAGQVTSSNGIKNHGIAIEAGEDAADALAAATDTLEASVQAGLAAAQEAAQANIPAGSSSSTNSSGIANSALDSPAGDSTVAVEGQGPKGKKSTALGSLLLLLWSTLLLAIGFIAAAVLAVLEGEALLAGGSGSSGIGFCGVGPGGSYGLAADLCTGIEGAVWPVGGNEGVGWSAAVVQHGRRFGAAHQQ